jgi:hypothetical protein
LFVGAVLFACTTVAAEVRLALKTNDAVGFVGGGDVAAALDSGHLESLLAIHYRGKGIRFRNFGWEGDTVFEQPRDVGFPSLLSNLQKAGVTVAVLQFGRTEALSGKRSLTEFRDAYGKLLDGWAPKFRQLILVTPVPFEDGGGLLPKLSKRNPLVARHAEVIRELARERQLTLIDLFEPMVRHHAVRLTSDGVQLTPGGHKEVAAIFFRNVPGHEPTRDISLKPEFEAVRQAVIAKNRLWFDYARPQNWAFLGGDRTSQPSSRDHRDPKVRWFPAEMEKYPPLIAQAEKRIDELAAVAARNP